MNRSGHPHSFEVRIRRKELNGSELSEHTVEQPNVLVEERKPAPLIGGPEGRRLEHEHSAAGRLDSGDKTRHLTLELLDRKEPRVQPQAVPRADHLPAPIVKRLGEAAAARYGCQDPLLAAGKYSTRALDDSNLEHREVGPQFGDVFPVVVELPYRPSADREDVDVVAWNERVARNEGIRTSGLEACPRPLGVREKVNANRYAPRVHSRSGLTGARHGPTKCPRAVSPSPGS